MNYTYLMEEIKFEDKSILKTKGNLFEPMPPQADISGGWLEKEKKGKRTTIKKVAAKAAIVVGDSRQCRLGIYSKISKRKKRTSICHRRL